MENPIQNFVVEKPCNFTL